MDELKTKLVIYSMLTENEGHLLLDDEFWVNGVLNYTNFKEVEIITSQHSAKLIQSKFSDNRLKVSVFKEFNYFKRKLYRAHLVLKIVVAPVINNSTILLQGFDEIGFLFFYLRNGGSSNQIITVPTNNISVERYQRSPFFLKTTLNFVVTKSNVFAYHSNYELDLLKKIIQKKHTSNKFKYLKYHLLEAKPLDPQWQKSNNTISVFGPEMESKPIEPIIELIIADIQQKFMFQLFNFSDEAQQKIKEQTNNSQQVHYKPKINSYEGYLKVVAESTFVLLPHNKLFEGKISGILSDCISLNTIVISNKMSPVTEYSSIYGDIGYIYDYTQKKWANKFIDTLSIQKNDAIIQNMLLCSHDHKLELIISDFLNG